jgi:hypothetical protein
MALLVALGGCRGSFSVQAGSGAITSSQAGATVTRSQINLNTDSALGAAILLGIIASDGLRIEQGAEGPGNRRFNDMPSSGSTSLPLDPNRKIRVQDCSKPVDLDGGNLICR